MTKNLQRLVILWLFISLYNITTHLLYRIYSRKNPKEKAPKNGYRSTQIIAYKYPESMDYVIVNYQVILLVDMKPTFIRYSVDSHAPAFRPLFSWPLYLVVDFFKFDFSQLNHLNLQIYFDIFNFKFTMSNHLKLHLVVDIFHFKFT
jgi:hypothetical protein